jgi:hypothetical protein
MAELARGWALFSVRSWSPLRGAVRARQYRRAGCPIYFVERLEIDVVCAKAGLRSWSVAGPHAGSYLVLGHV